MKSIFLILGTALTTYTIEIILVGGFLAFLMERKEKEFSWIKTIPVLFLFFAVNEFFYIPAVINANVSFTIHNQELANFLGVEPNESLTKFVLEDFASISIWVIEASLSYAIGVLLFRKKGITVGK